MSESWPHFSQEDCSLASEILSSGKVNYWTGEHGKKFEKEFALYVGAKHSIAVMNGTVALDMAYRILGIGPGDEVIVPSRTYVATSNSVVLTGATPIFVDVDPRYQTLDPICIENAITGRTKAIVVVHLGGNVADLSAICKLAKERKIAVVEDCAQCHGAKFGERYVGTFGDFGAFSFCQDKIMTTAGEGGMLVTNDTELWSRAWSLKEHGKSYDRIHQPVSSNEHFVWAVDSFGSNFRMTEIQAAIGRRQLALLDSWIEARRRNAGILRSHLSSLECLEIPEFASNRQSVYYRFYCFIKLERLADGWTRDSIITALAEEGVRVFLGSCSEVYLERCYQNSGLAPEARLPNARQLGETSLAFLTHPTLAEKTVIQMAQKVRDFFLRIQVRTGAAQSHTQSFSAINSSN